MKITDLKEKLKLTLLTKPIENDKTVTDCYIGDLLSVAMQKAAENCAWLTVNGNINCIAVAYFVKASCVILTEGAVPDSDALEKANEIGLAVFSTEESSYKTAVKISKLLGD